MLALSLVLIPVVTVGQSTPATDSFLNFLNEITAHCPVARSGVYAIPTESDISGWNNILRLFISRELDSCKIALAQYNYTLHQVRDITSGKTYDVIREKFPIQRGWGTFIHNRSRSKRLYVHVDHPLDDPGALMIGAELFRRLNGEWLLIAGTSKRALKGKLSADVGLARRSVFQKTHEVLSNLTHVSLSIHSYDEKVFGFPINATDLIISNGRTSDQQWGISQLSLAVRDSLRAAGFRCGLAMYDSGYARLAGGWNQQGVFSNDSVGFGHWLYVELSRHLREDPNERERFTAAADRALDIVGRKISQQVNRTFGLVSPRVVKVDSRHGLLFEPSGANVYRVISFDETKQRVDSSGVRVGNWFDLFGRRQGIASITPLDSAATRGGDLTRQFRNTSRDRSREFARIVEGPAVAPSRIRMESDVAPETSVVAGDEQDQPIEPIQVHRIPLEPLLASTFTGQSTVEKTVFRWDGILARDAMQGVPLFQINTAEPSFENIEGAPKFLVPLINSTYGFATGRLVGIRMTDVLMSEIARLVTQHQVPASEVGLLAEQSERGDYYLRIFPKIPDSKPKGNPR